MSKLPPFNVTMIQPDEYIKRREILPVTSMAMFETSTNRFHPDGLYSEVIFGQVGSRERLVRRGYIDLRTKVITPHLYSQLITLKNFYKDVLAGKAYAKFDPETKDLVKTTADDPDGNTGYSYFIAMLSKIKFPATNSIRRMDKIALINQYRDCLIIDKLIVLPAGVRDVKMKDGHAAPEEVNKYYLSILSLCGSLPDDYSEDPTFDAIRYQIQMKIQEVYEYIYNILDGKGGFAQGRYTHRAIVYSNRNVITTATPTRVPSPTAPNAFSIDDVEVPLFQAMKAAQPKVINKLKYIFFDPIFNNQTNQVPLIAKTKDGYRLNYEDVDTEEINKFITSDGLDGLINGFRNVEIQLEPASVTISDPTGKLSREERQRYLYLVYDEGDRIRTFRNIADIEAAMGGGDSVDPSKIRPMTWTELFYLATWDALRDAHCTATRHPMLLIENIQLYNVHLVSTVPSRIVSHMDISGDPNKKANQLPEYPDLNGVVKTSMSVHPATLSKYDGDHDGDVLGLNILMSDEANKELTDFLQSPLSMVDVNGKLVYGLSDCRLVKYNLYSTTWHPL